MTKIKKIIALSILVALNPTPVLAEGWLTTVLKNSKEHSTTIGIGALVATSSFLGYKWWQAEQRLQKSKAEISQHQLLQKSKIEKGMPALQHSINTYKKNIKNLSYKKHGENKRFIPAYNSLESKHDALKTYSFKQKQAAQTDAHARDNSLNTDDLKTQGEDSGAYLNVPWEVSEYIQQELSMNASNDHTTHEPKRVREELMQQRETERQSRERAQIELQTYQKRLCQTKALLKECEEIRIENTKEYHARIQQLEGDKKTNIEHINQCKQIIIEQQRALKQAHNKVITIEHQLKETTKILNGYQRRNEKLENDAAESRKVAAQSKQFITDITLYTRVLEDKKIHLNNRIQLMQQQLTLIEQLLSKKLSEQKQKAETCEQGIQTEPLRSDSIDSQETLSSTPSPRATPSQTSSTATTPSPETCDDALSKNHASNIRYSREHKEKNENCDTALRFMEILNPQVHTTHRAINSYFCLESDINSLETSATELSQKMNNKTEMCTLSMLTDLDKQGTLLKDEISFLLERYTPFKYLQKTYDTNFHGTALQDKSCDAYEHLELNKNDAGKLSAQSLKTYIENTLIPDIKQSKTDDQLDDQQIKKIKTLRQIAYLFRNQITKETYDAFIRGEQALLTLREREKHITPLSIVCSASTADQHVPIISPVTETMFVQLAQKLQDTRLIIADLLDKLKIQQKKDEKKDIEEYQFV